MKKLFLKKILISLALFFIGYQVLHLQRTEKFIIKTLVRTFTPYEADFVEIKDSIGSYFKGCIDDIYLSKNGVRLANLTGVSWDIPTLSFKDITFKIHRCTVLNSKMPVNFDFSSMTPGAIGYGAQKIPKNLKRFSSITIDSLEIQDKNLKVELNRKDSQWSGTISNNKDILKFSLTPFDDHSKITIDALWEEKKISLTTKIYDTSIDFTANFMTSPFISEAIVEFLGQEVSIAGHLEKSGNWQLSNLVATTSKGHKLDGKCEQNGHDLKGSFVYEMPLPKSHKHAKCAITLEGPVSAPSIKWQFQEGIEPLETAFGECKVIDINHLKVTGQLHHDAKNTASLDLDIYLNPFSVSGTSSATVQDLQKFLHAFWPSARGNLTFNALLENVSGFEKGKVSISGEGVIQDAEHHLPIKVAIHMNDGLGKGTLKLIKGLFHRHPLEADIAFDTTNAVIHIEKCAFTLQDLKLSILKPISYDFQTGLTPAQMQFCGGTVTIEKLKILDLDNSTGTVTILNVQLEKLKAILGLQDATGLINGKITKVAEKPMTLNLVLSKGFWHRVEKKQVHKILNDMNASLDATYDRSIWKWKVKIKDQDKIDLLVEGEINAEKSTIDAQFKGTSRLKLLTEWIATDDRIFGDITVNVRAKGSLKSPDFEGTIDADNGLYEHSEVGTFYQNITIHTKAQGKRFVVTKFEAQDVKKSTDPDHGQVRGEGWIDFTDPFSPVFNVPLHLQHTRIAQHDGFISDATGTIIITGKGADVGCKGEVTLEKVHYFLDQSVDKKVPNVIDRSVKKTKHSQEKVYATAFPLDILVHALRGSFKVTGLGADTSWEGDFYVKKSILNPFLVGSVKLHEGTLDVLGKVLKLTRGTITFVDDDRNNPRIDIKASKNLGDGVRVAIEIKGTGEHTIVDFTAIPSMPKEEVLALLLFGKKLGEVSVFQSIQLAELAKSKDTSSGFFEKFRNNFGFDQFEFKTSVRGGLTSPNDEDITPQERALEKTNQAVRIGKEFGKVKIAIEQGAGTQTSKVVVSTPLGSNFALEGDVGGDQNSGVGVSWIKRY